VVFSIKESCPKRYWKQILAFHLNMTGLQFIFSSKYALVNHPFSLVLSYIT